MLSSPEKYNVRLRRLDPIDSEEITVCKIIKRNFMKSYNGREPNFSRYETK
jgi:hypothetical protein